LPAREALVSVGSVPFVVTAACRDGGPVPGPHAAAGRLPADRQPGLHRFEQVCEHRVEGLLEDPEEVVDLVLDLVRAGGWVVGIGVGRVTVPRAREGEPVTGLALEALGAARRRPQRLAVRAADGRLAAETEGVLALLAAVVERRTDAAWAAVDLVARGSTTTDAAAALGVSRQAVGQRLAATLWPQEQQARPAAARLLGLLDRPEGRPSPEPPPDRAEPAPGI
jgi:hypothetical protein